MILQCEACKTRFRLDDSKLKPGGVKVRCSKCRHVFLAGVEPAHEESEFEAVLSGLGAPAPGAEAPAEPAAAQALEEPPASEEFRGFGEEPLGESAAQPAEPAPEFDPFASLAETGAPETAPEAPEGAAGLDFGAFAESAAAPAPATTEAEIDFGGFSFEEPVAPAEVPVPAAAEPDTDLSEFSFEEPAAQAKTPAPAEDQDESGFQEFSFEEPAASQEAERPASTDTLQFGEYSFESEPSAAAAPQPVAGETAGAFQEFSFEEEAPTAPAEPAAEAPLDFGAYSFEEAAPAEASAQAPAETAAESFSFEELAPEAPSTPAAAESAMDFGELSFESTHQDEAPEEPASSAADFGALSLEESAAPAPATEHEAAPPVETPQGAPQAGGESLDFGDFSFDQDLFKKEGPSSVNPPEGTEPALTGAALGAQAPLSAAPEDEIPPFPVSSRRKGRSALTVSLVTISVVMVVALSGIGFYVMQSGPAAFDKLGIGFVGKWFGMESPEEGRITIAGSQASFHQNQEAGELFVVKGRAVNTFKKARASIHIKVTLYDKAGRPILQKTAYCGNKLTDEQLATLPMAKIDTVMNNQFGDSLANMGVQPGKSIPFVVAIANVPKEAADFGVESIGSTVSGP